MDSNCQGLVWKQLLIRRNEKSAKQKRFKEETKILSNLFIDHSQAPLVAFRATNSDQIFVVLAEKKVILIQLPLRKKLALDNVNYGGNGNTQ